MAQFKISQAQAQEFLQARKLPRQQRSAIKKRLFADIKRQFGLPQSQKVKIWVEDPGRVDYCVLRDKRTGKPLDNGIPEKAPVVAVSPVSTPVLSPAPVAVSPSPAATPVVPVTAKKTPAKKTVTPVTANVPAKKTVTPATAKATAKKTKAVTPVTATAKKAAAKTVPEKAAVKASPAKKAKGVFSATKTATANIEVRATIGGVRKRLGWVSTEEMKAKVVAKAKAEAAA